MTASSNRLNSTIASCNALSTGMSGGIAINVSRKPARFLSNFPTAYRTLKGHTERCNAGLVLCRIEPIADVYACPFAINNRCLARNVLSPGGFYGMRQTSELFQELRPPQTSGTCTKWESFDACRGGRMAAKFFTGLPLNGPDPECLQRHRQLAVPEIGRTIPLASQDHSHASTASSKMSVTG